MMNRLANRMMRANDHGHALVERSAQRRERGQSTIEGALVAILVLIPLLLGVIDFGRAYFYSIEVENAAKAGAQFGAQNTGVTMIDLTGMATAAKNEAPDIAASCTGGTGACWTSGYPLAQWGCECSTTTTAGPGANPNACALTQASCTHLVNFVVVTTKATYTPLFNFFGMYPNMTLSGQAKVRLAVQ